MVKTTLKVLLAATALTSSVAFADYPANQFSLSSNDIAHGEFMASAQEFQGFGCTGDNVSPHLSWSNAPEGTKAFALMVYDPDAPTGSGWWHWQLVNIPANVTELKADAGNADGKNIPKGSMQIENDYGFAGYGGACPPVGDGAHRYQFTLHALSQTLELPEGASGALTGYMVNANTIESVEIEALFKR